MRCLYTKKESPEEQQPTSKTQAREQFRAQEQSALAQNPEAVAKIKEGNKKPVDFLIGQVMKKARGKADPAALTKLIQKTLRG